MLKAELSALPGDDARRESFMSAQACKAARSFWQAIPHSALRLKNRFWAEVVSNSFGLASPAMAPWVGTLIGDTGLRVDPRGDIFFTSTRLCNKYRARTIWSSAMELELRDTLREADVPVVWQVRGAFEDLIRGEARGRYFRQKSKQTRDGIVPDLRWRDEDGEFVLGDVKTIGFGKTRYWGRRPASTRAVDARATQWRRLMCTPCADPTSSRHIALQRSSTQARTG